MPQSITKSKKIDSLFEKPENQFSNASSRFLFRLVSKTALGAAVKSSLVCDGSIKSLDDEYAKESQLQQYLA